MPRETLYTVHTLAIPVWDRKELDHDGDYYTTQREAQRIARNISKREDVLCTILTSTDEEGDILHHHVYRGGKAV